MKNNLRWGTGAHNETSVNNHTLPVASWGYRGLKRGGWGCALTGGRGEMVQKMAIRFHRGVIGMAETNASEGALEVGKFLRKGQKGGAPPFKEDMGS